MKKLKIALFTIGLLFILLTAFRILDNKFNPNYTLYKVAEVTKEEKNEIKKFYDNQEISKGNLFDVKYVKYNSNDDSIIQFLKKTKSHIPDLDIDVYDELTNEMIGGIHMPVDFPIFMAAPYSESKMLLFTYEGNMIWNYGKRDQVDVNSLYKDKDLKKLKLLITYRNGKEIHHIEAPGN